MSKHIPRKSQWIEISNKRFNGFYGYVELNNFGKWDAIIVFKTRIPLDSGYKVGIGKTHKKKVIDRPWRKTTKHCGEYKRVREAMMAVESAAEKMKAENNPDKLI